MKLINCALILVVSAVLSACGKSGNSAEWKNIGNKMVEFDDKPEKLKTIQYILFNTKTTSGPVDKNTDVVDLQLAVQSGRALGASVMLSVYECWAPDVRHGLPTVLCSANSNGDIYLSGDEKIRSQLLHLADEKKIGAVIGKLLYPYAGAPVVQVL